MQLAPGGTLRLAATDLSNHLACRHLTALDLQAARGERPRPGWRDPALELLALRGEAHEAAYLEHLRGSGIEVVDLRDLGIGPEAFEATVAAMRRGAPAIAQGWLESGRWRGRPDVLMRVEEPSWLGAWSYEAVDTKLARETKAATILQLGLYSELIGEVQGRLPERMHVLAPGRGFAPESFAVRQYAAYQRLVKRRLEQAVGDGSGGTGTTYPDPVPHCEVCSWFPECDARRRADDHLSLVADLRALQIREFQRRGVSTLAALADLPLPLPFRPERGAPETYERAREQARVQLAGRLGEAPVHELLPVEPGRGLARLPAPSPGDVFFDLEGDPFVGEGGREYLFGWAAAGADGRLEYRALWALDAAEEKAAFERFVDEVTARRERWPDLHVYHFAPYEEAALKRLMGRHATREAEVDRLLRGDVLIDLHAVARQAVRASVERYGLKELEAFTGYERELALEAARAALRAVEWELEVGSPEALPEATRAEVERYNRDDCLSTAALRAWLEALRQQMIEKEVEITRPEPKEGAPSEALDAWQQRVAQLKATLLAGIADDPAARSAADQARWLLAHTLEWFRREEKATWWDYFRLREASPEELFEDSAGIAGLRLLGAAGGTRACPIHRYRWAEKQEVQVGEGDTVHAGEIEIGNVTDIDPAARLVEIKKRSWAADTHAEAVFAHDVVSKKVPEAALLRLAEAVASSGIDGDGSPYRPARELLLHRAPSLPEQSLQRPHETTIAAAERLALDDSMIVLPIQGPPGSGKTYTAARMACALVAAGRRVGVTAMSHKVIRHLLEEIGREAGELGMAVTCVQKVSEASGDEHPTIREVEKNEEVLQVLQRGEAHVAAGTAWLWGREEMREAVDVLIVDEAGQMSLALALAACQGARRVVLVGDPQQLEQPLQGSHPEGTAVSALEHLLAGRETLEPHQGLFLGETRRLHPTLCAFTSELFYEGRLRALAGLENQELVGGPLPGVGLAFLPVEHEGNQNSSPEEVEAVAGLVGALTDGTAAWRDAAGVERPLALGDVLIVAPYNAQVSAISDRLPGARVGTVDRFQGQEAPVVVFSTATSSPEDAPRGMEFLYNPSRLNVATSRARCACVLVGSPRLFAPECRSPRQMQLANAFCRYLELAREVTVWPAGPPGRDLDVRLPR